MEQVRVASSNIDSFGYDEDQQILGVVFRGGARYQYFNVPKVVYLHLLNAPSKGKLLNETVKKAGYPYKRVG